MARTSPSDAPTTRKKPGPKPGTPRKGKFAKKPRPAPTLVVAPLPQKKYAPPPTVTVRDKYPNTSGMAAAAAIDENKPLTEMQRHFVREWAKGETVRTALARAGYTPGDSIGYRMAKMPNILKMYREEKAKYEQAAQMSRKKVMDMHLEAFEMAKLMSEPASMVSAAREIGRMCGYYEPVKHVIEHNHSGEVTLRQLSGMSDAELMKLMQSDVPLLQRVEDGAELALEMDLDEPQGE